MRRMIKFFATAMTVATMFTITNSEALAAPYVNKEFELLQPDGSKVQVEMNISNPSKVRTVIHFAVMKTAGSVMQN
jgi:hypothetical protein